MSKRIDVIIGAKNKTKAAFKNIQQGLKKFSTSFKSTMSNLAQVGKIAAGIFVGIVAAGTKAVAMYKVQAQSEAKLEAALKATGYAAGKTATELKKQASELQKLTGIGDEVIISTQAMVATFKNIKGDEFDRTTKAALDMGAMMRKAGKSAGDVESASLMLGKALNDPIGQLGALSRVGIAFTKEQKDQIKGMAAAGDMAGAQAVILRELETEFGGVAEAMGQASHGTDQLKAGFGDMIERIGEAIVESDGFDDIIANLTETMANFAESGYIELWAENIRNGISGIMPMLNGLVTAFTTVKKSIEITAGAVAVFIEKQKGKGIGERLLNVVAPISLIKDVGASFGEASVTTQGIDQTTQARLAGIRKERQERAKIKEDEEKLAMSKAQSSAAEITGVEEVGVKQESITEEVGKQATVETEKATTISDILDTRETSDTIALESANEAVTIAEKQLEVEEKILDTKKQGSDLGGVSSDYSLTSGAFSAKDYSDYGSFALSGAASAEADRISKILKVIQESNSEGEAGKQTEYLQVIAENTIAMKEVLVESLSIS
jgi:hypothetical protein